MLEIVKELPEGIALSERLRERAPFFLLISSLGIGYYIAATPNVRRLLELDEKGREEKPDRRRKWDNFRKADALRDIVASLELQVRDVVLAGIEDGVTRSLLNRMAELMAPTIRGEISKKALLLLETDPEKGPKNSHKKG